MPVGGARRPHRTRATTIVRPVRKLRRHRPRVTSDPLILDALVQSGWKQTWTA